MDILKCEAFLKAVDTGSLSQAAMELGYTPSGVTRMVNALEAELGFPLLSRNSKGVTVTTDGGRMLPILREMVRCNELAFQTSAEIRGLSVGNLMIGAFYSVASSWLPKIIKAFQADYPKIYVNTLECSDDVLLEWLEEGRIDCCFFSNGNANSDWIPLKMDKVVVWLPKDHPNANLAAFPIRDFAGAPYIETMQGSDPLIKSLAELDEFSPDVRFTTRDFYTTYAMVSAGLGISVNNELLGKNWSGDVVILPLDPPRYLPIGIVVKSLKDASPATKKFIDCARRLMKD